MCHRRGASATRVCRRYLLIGSLLAVDVGLRCGFALYGWDGKLRRYRSQNFGSRARLRRGVPAVLADEPDLECLVFEGTGPLAEVWQHEADRREVDTLQTTAEVWRPKLLYQRERRSGAQAKHTADGLARRVIEWSGAPRPTSLRHDAAEAILVGLWGVLEVGWLAAMPAPLRR